MQKEYYEIKTCMNFEKIVLVPKNEVSDENEAKKLVSEAIKSNKINLFDKKAQCKEKCNGVIKINDSLIQNFSIPVIHSTVTMETRIKSIIDAIVNQIKEDDIMAIFDFGANCNLTLHIFKDDESPNDIRIRVMKNDLVTINQTKRIPITNVCQLWNTLEHIWFS